MEFYIRTICVHTCEQIDEYVHILTICPHQKNARTRRIFCILTCPLFVYINVDIYMGMHTYLLIVHIKKWNFLNPLKIGMLTCIIFVSILKWWNLMGFDANTPIICSHQQNVESFYGFCWLPLPVMCVQIAAMFTSTLFVKDNCPWYVYN